MVLAGNKLMAGREGTSLWKWDLLNNFLEKLVFWGFWILKIK